MGLSRALEAGATPVVLRLYALVANGNGAKIPQPSLEACQEVTHTEPGDADGSIVGNFLFSLWGLGVSAVA